VPGCTGACRAERHRCGTQSVGGGGRVRTVDVIYLALCSHALCEELSPKYAVLLCTTRAFLLRDRAMHVFAEVRTVALGIRISERYQIACAFDDRHTASIASQRFVHALERLPLNTMDNVERAR